MSGHMRWLCCLAAVIASEPLGAVLPQPPRNGRNSIQLIAGGRNAVPLCIVPPRVRVDGSAIPTGTPCTIVIYRSHAKGLPNSYDQEVGRALGKVTKPDDLQPWINVTATVPPDNAKGGTVYLASSAIIDGQESDLNNQWLTYDWVPGSFKVRERPDGGRDAGLPPARRAPMVPVRPLGYPDWITSGTTGTGAMQYVTDLPSAGKATAQIIRFTISGQKVSGRVDADVLAARVKELLPGVTATITRNQFTAGLAKGVLTAHVALTVVLKGKHRGEVYDATEETEADLTSQRSSPERIEGTGKGTFVRRPAGKQPETQTKRWDWVALLKQSGRSPCLSMTAQTQASSLAPGPSFRLPCYEQPLPQLKAVYTRCLKMTYRMSIGDRQLLQTLGVPVGYVFQQQSLPRDLRRAVGSKADWLVGPPEVVKWQPAGNDAIEVRATANGVAEVWSRIDWTSTEGGETVRRPAYCTWLLLVGPDAWEAYDRSRGETRNAPLVPSPGPISRGTVNGKVIGPDGQPVAGAMVSLVHEATGKTYTGAAWVTRADGGFSLDLAKESSGYGLKEGRYQVVPFKRNPGGPTNDLWPVAKPTIELTRDRANAGPLTVTAPIRMERVGVLYGL